MKCPNCGAEVYAGESKCKACGQPLDIKRSSGRKRIIMLPPFRPSAIRQEAWKYMKKMPISIILLMLVFVVLYIISGLTSIFFLIGVFLFFLVLLPYMTSCVKVGLCATRGAEFPSISSAWNAVWMVFKKQYLRTFTLNVLLIVFVGLWSLLLIIPGIVHFCAYSMALFVSFDHPELSPLECIRESKRLMKGHKMDLFLLLLSFFGWYLLVIVTLGYGCVWVFPYISMSLAVFYDNIRAEKVIRSQEDVIIYN